MTITRSLTFLVIGQSYGREGYENQPAYAAFCEAVRKSIDSDPATINSLTGLSVAAGDLLQMRNHCTDGSAILEANDGGPGYWVDDDLVTPGPLLSAVVTAIGTYGGVKPMPTIWSHGEQDAGIITTEAQSQLVKTAVNDVLWPQIRTAIHAANANGQPIWVDMLGPRYSGDELAEYWIRDRMIELIDATTRIYRGAEKYALQLDDTTHPTSGGYAQMGAHTGRKVASWLLDTTQSPRGPGVTSPVRSGNNVTVTISVPAGKTLVKPSSPDFFGLFDGSENRIPITGYSWNGNDLTLSAGSQPAKLRYPCRPIDNRQNVDINNIIRLSSPVDPVYTGEPGLVLESMATHTF